MHLDSYAYMSQVSHGTTVASAGGLASPDSTSGSSASPGQATARRVVVAGLVVSALLAAYSAYWEWRGVREEVRELAGERTELLASTMRVSMQVLYSLQSLHAATGGVAERAFGAFARDERARHPELQALEWAPRVPAADRDAFEAGMRRGGRAGFTITEITAGGELVAAAARPVYFPVQWIEPTKGNEAAEGLDLARDDRRGAALARALKTRGPAATAPIRLAQEPGDEPGFLVFLPLYRADDASDEGLEGFVLAVFRFADLIRHAMRDMDGRGIAFAIDDVTEQPTRRVFGGPPDATTGRGPLAWVLSTAARDETLDIAGRRWRLGFVPEAGFMLRHLPWQTATMFASGLLITALVAGSVRLLARRGSEVAEANAALQAEVLQREEAVRVAVAASRSKSSFLANMSHEIRTPMNAVLGYAQLLRRDARLDDGQREAVNAIVTSGSHLMNQINEVLDFSKIESGRLELNRMDFDVDALLRDVERMFQPRCREKSLSLVVVPVPSARAWVHGDGVKLQQILINLVGNAVRFTNVGEIALRAQVDDDAVGGVAWYRFDVIDSGPGIAAAERERIFEPFYQSSSPASAGGSGLGLAIAERQAALMGGRLVLASELGVGSVFTLHLPLPPAEAGPAAIGGGANSLWMLAPGPPLTALVVDDVAANRDVLARLLRDAGCVAEEAGDAGAAMAVLASRAVDVLFVDMRMPGIDGLSMLAAVRALPGHASLRVLAYTAAAFEDDRARFIAAGCDGVIRKPIAVDALFETLAAVCGRRFDRVDPAVDAETPLRDPDYARMPVPRGLLERMVTAAELHSATVLKACLDELSALGPEHALLARHLRRHLGAYDMHAIARLLMLVPEAADGGAA